MARHADRGDEVRVVVATRGIHEMFPPETVARSRKELAAAHEALGVAGVRFLDFPAPKLDTVPICDLADALREVIRSADAGTVYIPHGGDLHADHRAVYEAALVAARPVNGSPVKRLLCYETLSETEWARPGDAAFAPTVFADITAYLDRKLDALSCLATELREFPHPRSLGAVEALARFRGAISGVEAAEAFMLVREIG